MANTYNWDFPALDTKPSEGDLTDVVTTIHWRITAVSDSETNAEGQPLSVSAYGTASAGEPAGDAFIAFDEITKDWCKAKVLDSVGKTETELCDMLDEQINNLANPPIVQKIPANW